MMEHRDAEELLVDSAQGLLDAARAAEVDAHAATCEDCSSWLETYRVLARESAALARPLHPQSELLARLVATPEGLTAAERTALDAHMDVCVVCRNDVALARESLNEARQSPGRRRSFVLPAALAASIAAVATAGVLFGQLRALKVELDQVGSWSGVVDPVLLQDTMRSAGETVIRVRPAQPFALLVVRVDPPDSAGPAEPVLFELRDDPGRLAWSATTTVDEVRRGTSNDGAMFLQVPVSGLAAGRYRFAASVGAADPTILLERFVYLETVP